MDARLRLTEQQVCSLHAGKEGSMRFKFQPEDGAAEHFSAKDVGAAQDYAAETFKDRPGIVWRDQLCPMCDGAGGWTAPDPIGDSTCLVCKGTGHVESE